MRQATLRAAETFQDARDVANEAGKAIVDAGKYAMDAVVSVDDIKVHSGFLVSRRPSSSRRPLRMCGSFVRNNADAYRAVEPSVAPPKLLCVFELCIFCGWRVEGVRVRSKRDGAQSVSIDQTAHGRKSHNLRKFADCIF